MAEEHWPYTGDPVTEPEWVRMTRLWRQSGVASDVDDELAASAVDGELAVDVAPGEAWLDGFYYRLTDTKRVTLDDADLNDPRRDLVVVRSDRSEGEARLTVLTGEPAGDPEAPSPTRDHLDAGVYEQPIAEVYVDVAVAEVTPDDVTDRRTFADPVGRVLVVDSEDDLDDVDPTFHRFAVVDPEGADGQARWYDTDAEEWKVVGPVGNVLVVEDESELSQHDPPEQRFAVVDEGDGVGSLWYFRQSTEEWVQVTADGITEEVANATYQPQRLKVERSNKDSDGIFRDVVYRRHDGTAWMESRLRPEGSGPEYPEREVTWYEDDGETERESVTYDLSYDGDGELVAEEVQS